MADDLQKRVIQHAQSDLSNGVPRQALEKERSWMDKVMDHVIDRMVPEIGQMLDHKMAQGAAELSQALNSQSNAYVPYGAGQQGLTIYGPQQSYQEMLRDASRSAGQEQDRGIGR